MIWKSADAALLAQVRALSHPLTTPHDLDPLLERIGDARYVVLGEASHGTSEYYVWRARLTRRLVEELGFSFVAVEGDWPDCYRVNRFVKRYPDSGVSAREVLHAFARWPTWMWANWEIVALCQWLRRHNAEQQAQVGFYGLDVYSLWESMDAIIRYLEETDPDAVPLARRAYRCFEPYGGDEVAYGWSTRMAPTTCEDEVVALLRDLRQRAPGYDTDAEASFSAEQNARILVDAERYYRAMVRSDAESWNVRDVHMADTLDQLMARHGPQAKAIVWAHNTHVGDARATDMAVHGMVNIGQLLRERHAADGVVLVGCSGYQGQVIAGTDWGAPMERMTVPEAKGGSWDDVLHRALRKNALLLLDSSAADATELCIPRGQRAIGVVYHPQYERAGNYVPTVLPQRYDALLYLDTTRALHPLHLPAVGAYTPETYPWGL